MARAEYHLWYSDKNHSQQVSPICTDFPVFKKYPIIKYEETVKD